MKHLLQNDYLSCDALSISDSLDTSGFLCTNKHGEGLQSYIRSFAYRDEVNSVARTYIVRDLKTSMLVGYFTLKAGFIATNERGSIFNRSFDNIPGVELSQFAVDQRFLANIHQIKGLAKSSFMILLSLLLWPQEILLELRFYIYLRCHTCH